MPSGFSVTCSVPTPPPGGLSASGEATTDVRGFGVLVARSLRGQLQVSLPQVVVPGAHRRLVAIADDVLEPEIQRVHADGVRDLVHVRLAGEHALRLAGTAHVAARDRVRVHLGGLEARRC